ncbi:MAG: hypothetical protein GX913_02415 [Clostridiales bacterium]|nr:hypothetical protein [Clostridiales bacterium]
MKSMRLKKVQAVLLTLVLMIIFGTKGIGNVSASATPETTTVTQTIEIVGIEKNTRAKIDDTLELTIVGKPAISSGDVTFTSTNNNIAVVSSDGKVTFKNVGTTTITAVYKNPSTSVTASASVTFEVINPITELELKLDDETSDLKMKPGERVKFNVTMKPENPSNPDNITWVSSDPSVASVDKYGVVTAKSAGYTYVRAESSETLYGSPVKAVSAFRKITVDQPVTGLTFESEAISMKRGSVIFLKDTIKPDNATDKSLEWSSSDEDVATVDQNGKVTGIESGQAIITVKTLDGSEMVAECVITVLEPVSGISLSARSRTVEVGSKYTIQPNIAPSNADNKAVTYTSSDPTIATVDAKGVVTGLKSGTTLIVVKTDDRGLLASMTIEVKESVDALSFEDRETYIGIGLTKKLEAIFNPDDATDKRLKWTSNNTSMVTVNQSGEVYGVSSGTATITAEARDGSDRKATIVVHSVKPITGLIMSESKVKVREGDSKQMNVRFLPSDATVKEVKWVSSDPSIAKVDNFGVITAVKEGECKVTASSLDGGNAYAEVKVTVVKSVTAESVRVITADTTMLIGDSRTFTANIRPARATESFTWHSTDTSIATVDGNGKVTAVGSGISDIVAVSELSGVEGRTSVKVVSLNSTSVRLEQYDTYNLFIDGVKDGITWYSRNPRVATVSQNGKVTARQAGTTTIIARMDGKRVSCEIAVDTMKK